MAAVAAGGAMGITRNPVTAAAPFPWTPTSSPIGATLAASQVSPIGGLGNTQADLEQTYGDPDGLQGTMLSYHHGAIAATYSGARATRIYVQFDSPIEDLDRARVRTKALAPPDGKLIGTMDVGPNRVADLFHSDRLAQKVAPPHPDDPPGQYVVIYDCDSTGTIKDALLAVGNVKNSTT